MYLKRQHFAFVLAFVMGFALMQVVDPASLQANILRNEYDDLGTEDAIVQYHLKANDIVNDYVDALVNEEKVDVSYPTKEKGCTEDNRSTFCLSQVLSEELFLLETSLAARSDELDEFDFSSATSLDEALEASTTQQNTIQTEIENARNSLDAVLVAYNEAQKVYPVHEELMEFFGHLEQYNNGLADVRSAVEVMPAKFHDASTVECQ